MDITIETLRNIARGRFSRDTFEAEARDLRSWSGSKQNGVIPMTVADVDGVSIAGLLFDAGSVNSPTLLQVGPAGSSQNHAANPTV